MQSIRVWGWIKRWAWNKTWKYDSAISERKGTQWISGQSEQDRNWREFICWVSLQTKVRIRMWQKSKASGNIDTLEVVARQERYPRKLTDQWKRKITRWKFIFPIETRCDWYRASEKEQVYRIVQATLTDFGRGEAVSPWSCGSATKRVKSKQRWEIAS